MRYGKTPLLGLSLVNQDASQITHLFFILISFMLGAALSGAIIDNAVLRLGHRYSFALIVEGALLLMAMISLSQGSDTGHLFASAACGLQNGMVTTFSGAVKRRCS